MDLRFVRPPMGRRRHRERGMSRGQIPRGTKPGAVEEPAFRPACDAKHQRALAPAALDRAQISRSPTNTDNPPLSAPTLHALDSFEYIRDAAQNPRHPGFDD